VIRQGIALGTYFRDFLRAVVFPIHCRLCLAPAEGRLSLCRACRDELPWLTGTCRRCALPLAGEGGHGICPTCLAHPPVLDSCSALFGYQPPVDQWIHALKFGGDLAVGRLLGQLLAARMPRPDERTRVLAVPLHPRRMRQRGYNQAEEISRPLLQDGWLSSRCGCARKRHTEAQSGLPARDRHGNLRGAFTVHASLPGEHILLVDDVMTTGATLNELARTLKAAGASRVGAWVVARALKPD
jgi:ComF family protein